MAQSDRYGYLLGMDASALQDLYEQYKSNPAQIAPDWRLFFEGFDLGVHHDTGMPETPDTPVIPLSTPTKTDSFAAADNYREEFAVVALIDAYRSRGHLLSKTNPIRERKFRDPGVDLGAHGLTEAHLGHTYRAARLLGLKPAPLSDIIAHLQSIYCRSIGFEFAHIRETDIRQWCQDYFETHAYHYDYQPEKKKRILSKLNEAVVFENFLHKKFVGQKRFSLEGGENTIPALDAAINQAARLGVDSVVIGMAHRGRLNVLANILGKTYEYIFNEFEGIAQPDLSFGDGDVKYHLGFSGQTTTPDGHKVTLDLVPNPSHLEAVDPVLGGIVTGKQIGRAHV